MASISIAVERPTDNDAKAAVHTGLFAANVERTGDGHFDAILVAARDANSNVVGGIVGEAYWGYVNFTSVWVHPDHRRQGLAKQMLSAAEAEAARLGYAHAFLDTFSFQLPSLYLRAGYEVFGQLNAFPKGSQRLFMRKAIGLQPKSTAPAPTTTAVNGDSDLLMQTYASLLAQLAEMPIFLQHSASALSASRLQQMPAQDKFPLIEHLWHIRDCDVDLYAHRIRQVLQHDMPLLVPVDVGAWYEERHYKDRDGPTAIAEFAELRTALIAELSPLKPDALGRTGVRTDGNTINVLGLIEQLLDHDRDHRWRIARILSEFGDAP